MFYENRKCNKQKCREKNDYTQSLLNKQETLAVKKDRIHERETTTRTAVYLAANIKIYLMNEIYLAGSGVDRNIICIWCIYFHVGGNLCKLSV